MTPDIKIGHQTHLYSDQAYAEVESLYGKAEITDQCAATIASWWQGPGPLSREFTRLSTMGVFNPTRLLEEISYVRSEVRELQDSRALDMLATWAMHRHDVVVE